MTPSRRWNVCSRSLRKRFNRFVILLGLVATALPIVAQPGSEDGFVYRSGYTSIMALGRDIYVGLESKAKQSISPQPISIETDLMPFVKLLYYPDEPNKPIRGVWISVGFVDLVNHIAHAKAIDKKEKGYFLRYIESLSRETGEMELQPLPGLTNQAYWTEEMLNEQLSNFNSIVGMIIGIKLSHHYLGHYERYKDRLETRHGNAVPIDNLLTEREWREALLTGARTALDAGCTIEGVIPFFEAFDRMQQRPPWAPYFVPDKMKFSAVKKDLEKLQRNYFGGRRQ